MARGVSLEPGSVALVGDLAPAHIVLARGGAHAQLAPMGGSQRPPLRVGTPSGTLDLGRSGEALVWVRADGAATVLQLAGMGRVLTGALLADDKDDARARGERETGQERPAAQMLRASERWHSSDDAVSAGASDLDSARVQARAFGAGARGAVPTKVPQRVTKALESWMALTEAERERGHELQRKRAVAAQDGDQAEGQRLQAELIAHSQTVSRQREVLRARAERALAWSLLSRDAEGAAPTDVVSQMERAKTLLGR